MTGGHDGEHATVLISGPGRSGSTLLARILGEDLPGGVALGEAWSLWGRGLRGEVACSCGRPVASCPVWSARLGPEELREDWSAAVDRLVVAGVTARRSAIREALAPIEHVHAAAASGAGAPGDVVLIDSSKVPGYAKALMAAHAERLLVVEIYRHCSAVVHSDLKRHGGGARRAVWVGLSWLRRVCAVQLLAVRHRGVARIVVDYEDVVARPGLIVEAVEAWAGGPDRARALAPDDDGVRTNHILGGSSVGGVEQLSLSADDSWKRHLGWTEKAVGGSLDRVGRIVTGLGRRAGAPVRLDPHRTEGRRVRT